MQIRACVNCAAVPTWKTAMPQSLPVMLSLEKRRVLLVGGGTVALRRARSLMACGAKVVCVAPEIRRELRSLFNVVCHERAWKPEDLDGVFMVIIATDQPELNRQIASLAEEQKILVNRADNAPEGDFVVPAHDRVGPVTIAVHTGGISPAAAVMIRDELMTHLDDFWVDFLEAFGPWRERIKDEIPDPEKRSQLLRLMVGYDALTTFRDEGIDALNEYVARLLEDYRDEDESAGVA